MPKPPRKRKYRGRTYHLLPTSARNTKKQAERVAWNRRRYGYYAHVKKVGSTYYVYSAAKT